MVHGGGRMETAVEIAVAAATAAHELDRDRFLLYFGLIRAALSQAARKVFEMHPQGAQFFDESLQQSFNKGKSAAVLAFLEARGFKVSDAQRERILATSDLETLDRWVRRAATVPSVDALFQ
jgi:DNA primase